MRIFLSFIIIFFIATKVFAEGVYIDVTDPDTKVTVSSEENLFDTGRSIKVESHDGGSFTFASGAAANIFAPKTVNKFKCERLRVYSVNDGNELIGTLTEIEEGLYITARHVFVKKNITSIFNDQTQESLQLNNFSSFYQFVNKNTLKPIDFLVVSTEEFDVNEVLEKLKKYSVEINYSNEWASCEYGVHFKKIEAQNTPVKLVERQFSEGRVLTKSKIVQPYYMNLGTGYAGNDLTTFGSSGSSIWINNGSQFKLGGIVSCLDKYNNEIIRRPRVVSIQSLLENKDNQFSVEVKKIEQLTQEAQFPQAPDGDCIFTDGKGAGGEYGTVIPETP